VADEPGPRNDVCGWARRLCGGALDPGPWTRRFCGWARGTSGYVATIQLPSILLPLLLEWLRPFLALPVWTFWVCFTEMVISIRLLNEGTLLPPLKRVVAVINAAIPNIIALVVVLAPLAALTSLMHSQLLGLVDEGFSDPSISLTRIVNMLTAPPPKHNTEGEILVSQQSGATLLFFWSTFVIRLCFGSFIVAILVSAFNKVVADESASKQNLKRDASLPSEYHDASDISTLESIGHFTDYFLTARLHGSYEPRLVAAIETQIALVEMRDRTGAARRTQLMLPEVELVEVVSGADTAALLLRAYGARRMQISEAHEC